MNIGDNSKTKTKNLSKNSDTKKGVYTSYNSLAGKSEVKSVSKAMHDYIINGFAKIVSPDSK